MKRIAEAFDTGFLFRRLFLVGLYYLMLDAMSKVHEYVMHATQLGASGVDIAAVVASMLALPTAIAGYAHFEYSKARDTQ